MATNAEILDAIAATDDMVVFDPTNQAAMLDLL